MKIFNQLCIFHLTLSLFILSPTRAFPELFPFPPIEDHVAFVYSTTPVKQESIIMKKWGVNVLNSYSIEQYKRVIGPDGEKIIMTRELTDRNFGTSTLVLEFKPKGDRLRQTRLVREITKFSGEKALTYELNFDNLSKAYPEDTYALEVRTFLFRGLDMTRKSKFRYNWWTSEKAVVPWYIKPKSIRKIAVPAGTFNCYEIEMYIDIAGFVNRGGYLNKIVNPFMPDFSMYFDVTPPHHFVHYKGPIGPPGSPEVNLDLIKVVRGEKAIEEVRRRIRSAASYTDDEKLPDIF